MNEDDYSLNECFAELYESLNDAIGGANEAYSIIEDLEGTTAQQEDIMEACSNLQESYARVKEEDAEDADYTALAWDAAFAQQIVDEHQDAQMASGYMEMKDLQLKTLLNVEDERFLQAYDQFASMDEEISTEQVYGEKPAEY